MDNPNSNLALIESRVNAGLCPICCTGMNIQNKEEIAFVDYNGSKQPVHKRHIRFKEDQ